MMCDRYWREGIVLVERGLEDPHRDGCMHCRRAHAARQELVEWIPLVGEGYTGDPDWQAHVWQRIEGRRARVPWRWRWQFAGALAAACAVLLWLGVGREASGGEVPRTEVIANGKAKRGDDANVDDRLRVHVGKSSAVWIYHTGTPIQRCWPGEVSEACRPDEHGMVAEVVLSVRGEYQVLVISGVPVPPPLGKFETDRAAVRRAGVEPFSKEILVH